MDTKPGTGPVAAAPGRLKGSPVSRTGPKWLAPLRLGTKHEGGLVNQLYWQEHGAPNIRYKAWLQRKSSRALQPWRPQLCVLTPHAIFFFDSEEALVGAMWRSFVPSNTLQGIEANKGCGFTIRTMVRDFLCRTDTEAARQRWVVELRQVMAEGGGSADTATPPVLYSVGKYREGRRLGLGGFSEVRLAVNTQTNQQVALKMLRKSEIPPALLQRVYREIECLRLLRHPNIVRLLDVSESEQHIYLAMDYVKGPTLDDYAASHPNAMLPETLARRLFARLLMAVAYCHQHFVAHRDIKMENIIVTADTDIRLIDFGFSGNFKRQVLETRCGTYEYTAPEVLLRQAYKGPPCDAWSLGILLYALLAGSFPFQAQEPTQLLAEIRSKIEQLPFPPAMSAEAQDLIRGLLRLDPDARLTLPQAWTHPWVQAAGLGEDVLTGEASVEGDFSWQLSVGSPGPATPSPPTDWAGPRSATPISDAASSLRPTATVASPATSAGPDGWQLGRTKTQPEAAMGGTLPRRGRGSSQVAAGSSHQVATSSRPASVVGAVLGWASALAGRQPPTTPQPAPTPPPPPTSAQGQAAAAAPAAAASTPRHSTVGQTPPAQPTDRGTGETASGSVGQTQGGCTAPPGGTDISRWGEEQEVGELLGLDVDKLMARYSSVR